ncbi:MAG: DDE-type integrase/transposase/recombinase [Bacteroidales bacterium]|nr:DDE-type integrase/transposase/recombinase [Bacteroidales bacterium]
MYKLHTEKQLKYFDEVIRLHYEEGYGEDRISQILPIGHTTASRWIAIFAKEKGIISGTNDMRKPQENTLSRVKNDDAARAKAARESFALQYIKDIRKLDPGIGGPKLWYMYKTEFGCDYPIGRDRFCRIIDENNLKVRLRVRKPRITVSTHGLPTYPNLIKDFIPSGANQLWVSDITYIVVMEEDAHYHFCYLSLILDAYTEEIEGWSVGPTLDTTYPVEALKMALKRIEGKEVNLIHHSDRGCQYASRGD